MLKFFKHGVLDSDNAYSDMINNHIRLFDDPAINDEVIIVARDIEGEFLRWYGMFDEMPEEIKNFYNEMKHKSCLHEPQNSKSAYLVAKPLSIEQEKHVPHDINIFKRRHSFVPYSLVPIADDGIQMGNNNYYISFGIEAVFAPMRTDEFKMIYPEVTLYTNQIEGYERDKATIYGNLNDSLNFNHIVISEFLEKYPLKPYEQDILDRRREIFIVQWYPTNN